MKVVTVTDYERFKINTFMTEINAHKQCPVCGYNTPGVFIANAFYYIRDNDPSTLVMMMYPEAPRIVSINTWYGFVEDQINTPTNQRIFYPPLFIYENRNDTNGKFLGQLKRLKPGKEMWTVIRLKCSCGCEWETDPIQRFTDDDRKSIRQSLLTNTRYNVSDYERIIGKHEY